VACGYSQIPGVDFTEAYSPVIHDVTWRILLVLYLTKRYHAKIIDIETAFLYGDLEEEIYMDCPEGFEHQEDECLQLLQTIYGLVQPARQYWKKFTSRLKGKGFKGGDADPCLFMRKTKNGTVYIAIYVDDCLLIGDPKAIDEAIDDIKDMGFSLKVQGDLKDYLSCEIHANDDLSKAWLGQPFLIKKLEKKFGEQVKHLK